MYGHVRPHPIAKSPSPRYHWFGKRYHSCSIAWSVDPSASSRCLSAAPPTSVWNKQRWLVLLIRIPHLWDLLEWNASESWSLLCFEPWLHLDPFWSFHVKFDVDRLCKCMTADCKHPAVEIPWSLRSWRDMDPVSPSPTWVTWHLVLLRIKRTVRFPAAELQNIHDEPHRRVCKKELHHTFHGSIIPAVIRVKTTAPPKKKQERGPS